MASSSSHPIPMLFLCEGLFLQPVALLQVGSGRTKMQDGGGRALSQSPRCFAPPRTQHILLRRGGGWGGNERVGEGDGLGVVFSILVLCICVGIDFFLQGVHLPSI